MRGFWSPRRQLAAILGVSVLLLLPSMWMGFFLDDYVYVTGIEGRLENRDPSDSFFVILDGDPQVTTDMAQKGLLPWWVHESLKLSFFRPLAEASFRLDHAFFGRHAGPYHLQSLLWWAATVLSVSLVLRRALPGAIGMLAVLLFAVDESHVFSAAWVANRNALVAMAPTFFGLWAHMRWREEHWRPGRVLSIAGLGIGLMGGELALSVLAYLAAYELLAVRAPGGGQGSGRRLRSMAAGLWPMVLIGAAYAVLYRLAGYGTEGSGVYLDPMRQPLAYWSAAPPRMLMMLAGGGLGLSADFGTVNPALRPVLVAAGAVAVAVVILALRFCRRLLEDDQVRALRWLLAGGALALLPAVATFPSDRMFLVSEPGLAALLAAVLVLAWRAPRAPRRRILRVGGILLGIIHLVLAPLVVVAFQLEFVRQSRAAVALASSPELETARDLEVVMITAPDHVVAVYLPVTMLHFDRLTMAGWRVLSLAPHDHVLTRTGPRTLELEVVGGTMMRSLFEELYRDREHPLVPGTVLERGMFRVKILEAVDGAPTRVSFDFDRDLDDPTLRFLVWGEDGFARAHLPEAGETLPVPRVLGPAGY